MKEDFGKKAKRLLCGLLAFAVLAGYLPTTSVFAAEGEEVGVIAWEAGDGEPPADDAGEVNTDAGDDTDDANEVDADANEVNADADEAGEDADEAGEDADKAGEDADEAGEDADEAGEDADEAGEDADEADEDADEADADAEEEAGISLMADEVPVEQAENSPEGDGTKDAPYIVKSGNELRAAFNAANAAAGQTVYIHLAARIPVSGSLRIETGASIVLTGADKVENGLGRLVRTGTESMIVVYGSLVVDHATLSGRYGTTEAPDSPLILVDGGSFELRNGGILKNETQKNETILAVVNGGTAAILDGTVQSKAAGSKPIRVENGVVSVSDASAIGAPAGISTINAAAEVGGSYYSSLQDAINSAPAGSTVTLLSDVDITAAAEELTVDKDLTLDLNGHTIRSSSNMCIWTKGKSHVQLQNGDIVSTGNYGLYAYDNSTITVENATVTAPAAAVWSRGTIIAGEGSRFFGNSYGLFVVSTGKAIVNGGTVEGKAYGINVNGGGATEKPFGSVTIVSGTVKGDTAGISATTQDVVTVEGGSINGDVVVKGESSVLNVSGGYVNGSIITDGTADINITGGWFKDVVEEYLDLSVYMQKDGYVVPKISTDDVASVNGIGYPTLAEAVAAAEDGDTVILLKDVELTETVNINKNLTIDLGGNTVSGNIKKPLFLGNSTVTFDNGTIVQENLSNCIKWVNGGRLTLGGENGTSLTLRNTFSTNDFSTAGLNNNKVLQLSAGAAAIVNAGCTIEAVCGFGIVLQNDGTTVDVYGKVETYFAAISNNGTEGASGDDQVITIQGGAQIISSGAQAIFHPNRGEVNVQDGAYIKGLGGIEMRGGTLNVHGGTIIADYTYNDTYYGFAASANRSGGTVLGAGISISQHVTELPIIVKVSGGVIEGYYALFENDYGGGAPSAGIEISISGGAFTNIDKRNPQQDPYRNDNASKRTSNAITSTYITGFITGGNYSTEPDDEYIAEGHIKYQKDDGRWYIDPTPAPVVTPAPAAPAAGGTTPA
ncbi:MAG: hypothetical protein NC311_14645, partial [Muribaculaceae bacterium]|nr:hypothetical protein [Muribaculaceae bacterium]